MTGGEDGGFWAGGGEDDLVEVEVGGSGGVGGGGRGFGGRGGSGGGDGFQRGGRHGPVGGGGAEERVWFVTEIEPQGGARFYLPIVDIRFPVGKAIECRALDINVFFAEVDGNHRKAPPLSYLQDGFAHEGRTENKNAVCGVYGIEAKR